MSWTWCIGMFLPVLLLRDYGIWGFVVFAVPNVVGAAAMGWVLQSGPRVRELMLRHRTAVAAFSVVTIVFQLYFLGYITESVSVAHDTVIAPPRNGAWWGIILSFALSSAVGWLARRKHGDRGVAIVLWVYSAGLATYLLSTGMLDFSAAIAMSGTTRASGLALLAPICLFGFAFCPYLDATFLHAACRPDQREVRTAFTIGFGVLFFSMIIFTLGYASIVLPLANGASGLGAAPPALNFVVLHMVLQAIFTIWVHAYRVFTDLLTTKTSAHLVTLGSAIVLGGLIWALTHHWLPNHAGLTGGEIVYRCFMSFYGLVFPAYVWLCMIPTRDGHSGIGGSRGRRKLLVLGIAVLLAAPCFWMGFIERQEWWLAPGLGAVLFARVFTIPLPRQRERVAER